MLISFGSSFENVFALLMSRLDKSTTFVPFLFAKTIETAFSASPPVALSKRREARVIASGPSIT